MNGVCDTYCEGCEYLAKSSDVYCDYNSIEGRKRPCRAGRDCTVRRRPVKYRHDPRLVFLEKATLEAMKAEKKKPKPKHEQCGRPRGGRQSSMTEAEFRAELNAQRAARAANDPRRQADMEAIKDWRQARGLSQRAMGALIGVSCTTISDWETGMTGAKWELLEPLGIRRPPAS